MGFIYQVNSTLTYCKFGISKKIAFANIWILTVYSYPTFSKHVSTHFFASISFFLIRETNCPQRKSKLQHEMQEHVRIYSNDLSPHSFWFAFFPLCQKSSHLSQGSYCKPFKALPPTKSCLYLFKAWSLSSLQTLFIINSNFCACI